MAMFSIIILVALVCAILVAVGTVVVYTVHQRRQRRGPNMLNPSCNNTAGMEQMTEGSESVPETGLSNSNFQQQNQKAMIDQIQGGIAGTSRLSVDRGHYCVIINAQRSHVTVSASDAERSQIELPTGSANVTTISQQTFDRHTGIAEVQMNTEMSTVMRFLYNFQKSTAAAPTRSFLPSWFPFGSRGDQPVAGTEAFVSVGEVVMNEARDNITFVKAYEGASLQIDRFYKTSMSWMNLFTGTIRPPFSAYLEADEIYRIFIFFTAEASKSATEASTSKVNTLQNLHSEDVLMNKSFVDECATKENNMYSKFDMEIIKGQGPMAIEQE